MTPHSDRWALDLAEWAIPESILNNAEESPWIHPPALFGVPDQIEMNPSHTRALEAMPIGGSVLDIGCGGGVAAFALVPPAVHVIGVDHQSEMLTMFAETAQTRGVAVDVVEGLWPAVAEQVPQCDVVTCHHVVYNVAPIVPFLRELDAHAGRRVVIEMPTRHPLTTMSRAWKHFWNLERPSSPTSDDLMLVLEEIGIGATMQIWSGLMRVDRNLDEAVNFMRIRLCLPSDRTSEVRDFLESEPVDTQRELATIWWNKEPAN